MPINLAPEAQEDQPTINLNVNPSPELSQDVIERRSTNAAFGLSDKINKSKDDYYRALAMGKEGELRQEVASNLDYQKTLKRYDAINDLAKSRGSFLSPDDLNNLKNFIDTPPVDPSSVIEHNYANEYVDVLKKTSPFGWYDKARQDNPELVQQVEEQGKGLLAMREYARTRRENAESVEHQQGWIPWSLDRAKELFPGYTEAKLRGNVPGSSFAGLLGSQLNRDALTFLQSKNLEEFRSKFDPVMDRLEKDDPALAAQFARAIEGASQDETVLSNLFSAADIAGLYGAGKGVGALGRKLLGKAVEANDVRQAVKEMVKSNAATDTQPPEVVANAAAGDLNKASTEKIAQDITSEAKGTLDPAKDGVERLTSHLVADRDNMITTFGRYGQEIVNRVKEDYSGFIQKVEKALPDLTRVERIPEVIARKEAIQAVKETIIKSYPVSVQNSILDINSTLLQNITRNALTNTYDIVLAIGRHTGEYFLSRAEAEQAAERMGLVNPTIVPKGWAYYIALKHPMPETSNVVRDLLLTTKSSEEPKGLLNNFIGWLRTPEETLSFEHRANRKAAVYTNSVVMNVAKDEAKQIRQLTRFAVQGTSKYQRFKDWEKILNLHKSTPDPVTGLPGKFVDSPAELGGDYMTHIGRAPETDEVRAYFAYKRLVELDRITRELDLFKYMHRMGAQMHSVKLGDEFSPAFAGVRRNIFPTGTQDTIAVLGDSKNTTVVGTIGSKGLSTSTIEKLAKEVSEGKKFVIEPYDTDARPLSEFLDNPHNIRYIVTDFAKTEGLPLGNLIPRREGGHFVYGEGTRGYSHWIKQANMTFNPYTKMNRYEGDTTVMALMNRAMGKDIAEHLDNIRLAIKNKDLAAAKNIADTKLADITWKEIKSWFEPQISPEGKKLRPRLNLNEPIQVVADGETIASRNNELANRYVRTDKKGKTLSTFEDGTKHGNMARQFQIEYTGRRDAYEVYTMKDVGSANNPIYKYEPAKFVDPIPTMNRALSKAVNSLWMDDYKLYSVEHWLKSAENYLKEDWRNAPFWAFQNAEFLPNTPKDVLNRLEDSRFKIKQLWGVPSRLQATLDLTAQNLADTIYRKFGPEGDPLTQIARRTGLAKPHTVVPSHMLSRVTKPIDFLHAVTYHATIGLFAIPQFLVQNMTYATILGISGGEMAGKGMIGATLSQYARINSHPNILRNLDKIASNFGFKPGEWLESHNSMLSTGFHNVGGEHILRDSFYAPKVISNGFQQFLDMGQVFFKEGERNARYGAWHTAYSEFKRDNKLLGALSNQDRLSILERADLLSGNMTKASKSTLQMGVGSFPSQFLSYQMRLAEQFLGHRLTGVERARLFGTYAVLFGVPTAAGVAGIPFGEMFKKYALENYGYQVGDNWITSTFMQGLPSAMGAMATGNWYNVGERLGAPGLDVFRDILEGDKSWWQMVAGASGSMMEGTWSHSEGLRSGLLSLLRGDSISGHSLTPDDFVEPLRQIASVSKGMQVAAAINTQRWMSRNETYITDTSPLNAIFQGLTGLQTQQAQDIGTVTWSLHDRKENEKHVEQMFVKEFRRGLISMDNNSPNEAKKFFDNASAYLILGDFPNEKIAEAYSTALKANESLVRRLNFDLLLKNVPPSKKELFMRTYTNMYRRGEQ